MKINLTYQTRKITADLPITWDKVTFRQFYELSKIKHDDPAGILSVFLNLTPEEIKQAKIVNLEHIIELLSFLKEAPKIEVPKEINGFKIPKDLGFETIAQYEDIKSEIDNKERNPLEKFPLYCAIYACPQEYGEYNWKKAENMSRWFWDAPALEVLAVGNFTMMKLIAWKSGTKIKARRGVGLMKKLKLVLSDWGRALAFIKHCLHWRKKPGKLEI